MQNGYFRLVSEPDGYGVALYQPRDGGEDIKLGELFGYLEGLGIDYDSKKIEMLLMGDEDSVCHLNRGNCPNCPETYQLAVEDEGMTVVVRFIPPSSTGKRMTLDDFMKDMRFRGICFGIKNETLRSHFNSAGIYGTDLVIARGQEPTQGIDAKIEYCFNTDMHRRPTKREDGSVDYFHMFTINQCRKGDVLARIIPELPGTEGRDVFGQPIKPREVRRETLKFGRNIELSEDKLNITSKVDGHVSLVDDRVFVNDVYQIEGVGVSTGNIDYEGSIQVDGNVAENFEVKAGGDIIVNGVVEGARVIAGGNIIISKGMNGMQKGYLKAGRDIVVKFLENTKVAAGGYVETEAIMHSTISAGTEVRVDGRKGLIVGGFIQAGVKVEAKNIGAEMGAPTILEVGVNPLLKTQYIRLQVAREELAKTIQNAEVVLQNFKQRMAEGLIYNDGQLKYMRSVEKLVRDKGAELEQINQRLGRFQAMMEIQKQSEVVVTNEVFPGTTIIIGDATRTIQSSFHYCKFVREKGEITMKPF